jgi:hypothetical protein
MHYQNSNTFNNGCETNIDSPNGGANNRRIKIIMKNPILSIIVVRPIFDLRMAACHIGGPNIIIKNPILSIMRARPILERRMEAPKIGKPEVIFKTPRFPIMAAGSILERWMAARTIGKPKIIFKMDLRMAARTNGKPKIIIKNPILSIMAVRPILERQMVARTIGNPKSSYWTYEKCFGRQIGRHTFSQATVVQGSAGQSLDIRWEGYPTPVHWVRFDPICGFGDESISLYNVSRALRIPEDKILSDRLILAVKIPDALHCPGAVTSQVPFDMDFLPELNNGTCKPLIAELIARHVCTMILRKTQWN